MELLRDFKAKTCTVSVGEEGRRRIAMDVRSREGMLNIRQKTKSQEKSSKVAELRK